MTNYYSYSKLDTFRKCPMKYRFKYIEHREPAFEGIELFLGNRVHEALKDLYLDLSRYGDDRSALLDFYERRWDEAWRPEVRVVKPNTVVDDYFEQGEDCINTFYERNYPFDQNHTLALEHSVEFVLDQRRERWFRGRVDRVAWRGDGTYEIHDYKTSRLSPRFPFRPDADEQLSLYQVALESMHRGARPVELVWHFLQSGECFRLRREESDLVQIVNETNRFIDEIESERQFPARPSRLCDWCEFREICPEWV